MRNRDRHPLNDNELDDLLRQWKAPGAPESLEQKFFPPAARTPWWRWLWSGTIRVPVPLGLTAVILLVFAIILGVSNRSGSRAVRGSTPSLWPISNR